MEGPPLSIPSVTGPRGLGLTDAMTGIPTVPLSRPPVTLASTTPLNRLEEAARAKFGAPPKKKASQLDTAMEGPAAQELRRAKKKMSSRIGAGTAPIIEPVATGSASSSPAPSLVPVSPQAVEADFQIDDAPPASVPAPEMDLAAATDSQIESLLPDVHDKAMDAIEEEEDSDEELSGL